MNYENHSHLENCAIHDIQVKVSILTYGMAQMSLT